MDRGSAVVATGLVFALVLASCGSDVSKTGDDDGSGGSSSGNTGTSGAGAGTTTGSASSGVGGSAAGCPTDFAAAEGTPCSQEGKSCSNGCTDACSFCNVLMCQEGEWVRLEAHPLPCFSCGGELSCVTGEEYCMVTLSDTGGEDDYACEEAPAECGGLASCECLGESIAFASCVEPNDGEVTVTVGGA